MYSSKFKIFLCLQFFFCVSLAHAEEKITSYNVHIKVLKNSSLEIREQIEVIAEGNKIKRGIFRDFPTKYKASNGLNHVVGFNVIATSRDGAREDYHTEKLSNGVRVYLGKSDYFLNHGKHSYALSFKTNRQLGFFKDHDELYFNAIGHGWDFKIDRATVTVELPENIDRNSFNVDGFTGLMGQTAKAFNVTGYTSNSVSFATTRSLNRFEGFTVVVGWPKGIVIEPSKIETLISIIKDSILAVLSLLFTVLAIILNIFLWLTHGVDPKKGVIYPRFAAPEGFAPYDLPYLIGMGYSPKCLSSALVSSSIKGHTLIREQAGLLGFGTNFFIDKISSPKTELDNVEKSIVSSLFRYGETSIQCSSSNHSEFEAAKKVLTSFNESKLGKYYKKNLSWTLPGLALNGIACALAFAHQDAVIAFSSTTIAAVGSIIFFLLIKRYTTEGRAVLDEIEGYKMYLDTAEKGHYDNIQFPQLTQERFENHLPYAVALGVEASWMSAFRKALTISGHDANSYHPGYYMGNRSWHESKFLSDSASFSSTIASSSTPPGSSSGSSGGGSSGGGGGGGGGGGW